MNKKSPLWFVVFVVAACQTAPGPVPTPVPTQISTHLATLVPTPIPNRVPTDLSNENLSGANLSGADLIDADLSGTNLSGAPLDTNTQIDSKWRLVWEIVNEGAPGRPLHDVDLSEANLSGANLSMANLSNAYLQGAHLHGANLSHTQLSGAKLNGSFLRGADLSYNQMGGADLRQANLKVANLSDAELSGANLHGANLAGADLTNAYFYNEEIYEDFGDADLAWAKYDVHTVWPEGFDPKAAGALLDPLSVAPTEPASRRREVRLSVRHEVFRNAGRRCQQCGKTAADGGRLEVDHIIPASRGGSSDISNLQLLCFDCNRGKKDKAD